MFIRRSTPPRPSDMTLLVITSAGTALLAGLLAFPILMSGLVVANEATSPGTTLPAGLPDPSDVEPGEDLDSATVRVCQIALTRAD